MKKIFKLSLSIILLINLFVACSNPTNTSPADNSQNNSNPSGTTNSGSSTPRSNCSITLLDYNVNLNCNVTGTISNINRFACYSSDTYKIKIKSNPSNLQLARADYNYRENQISLFSANSGTITITLFNETANVESNECTVVFGNNSGNNGGSNGGGNNGGGNGGNNQIPSVTAFIGSWTTTYTNGLINTIQFRSDGTGRCYKTGNQGENTFTWSIQSATTLNIVNTTQNQNLSSTCTYNLNGNTLVLTNFIGLPQNTQITFTKN